VNENFTTGQRIGTWALNSALPGVGSFAIMKDKLGGGIQLGAAALAYTLTIAGIVNIVKGSEVTGGMVETSPYHYEYVEHQDTDALNGGIAMTVIGGLLLTGNSVFNIIRSATYKKPAPTLAGGFDPSGVQIALLPGNKVGFSYTMRF
jgi:hypothetical protein